ncbi:MAG: hypothetical protein WAN36_17145, partial [Calditrichia bacterium]
TVDIQDMDESGVPVIGQKYENITIKLGSGEFDPELEKQLIGVKKNEKRVVRQKHESAHGSGEHHPHEHVMEVQVKKIEEKTFPELNDEFVKNLNDDQITNLDQLKDRLRENMQQDLQHRSHQVFTRRLIDELQKHNLFEVPPSMVDNYLSEMLEDVRRKSPNREINEDTFRKQYRPEAIHNVRWFFLKKQIAEKENITVSDEEISNIIDSMGLDEKSKEVMKNNSTYFNHFKEDALDRKVLKFLEDNAEVVEVFPMQESEKKGTGREEPDKKGQDKAEKEKE